MPQLAQVISLVGWQKLVVSFFFFFLPPMSARYVTAWVSGARSWVYFLLYAYVAYASVSADCCIQQINSLCKKAAVNLPEGDVISLLGGGESTSIDAVVDGWIHPGVDFLNGRPEIFWIQIQVRSFCDIIELTASNKGRL